MFKKGFRCGTKGGPRCHDIIDQDNIALFGQVGPRWMHNNRAIKLRFALFRREADKRSGAFDAFEKFGGVLKASPLAKRFGQQGRLVVFASQKPRPV